MARPAYKALYEQEKAKRERAAAVTKKEMREVRDRAEDEKKIARTIVENNTEWGAREAIYIQQVAELQDEIRRLQGIIASLT